MSETAESAADKEFEEKERELISSISKKYKKGGDPGDAIDRICEEIWMNRRLNLELENQLSRLERRLAGMEPPPPSPAPLPPA